MIDEIHVKDLALIEDARLRPARGLTVVTGETGAGKTALLSALKLLAGERADASMVREGAGALLVEGRVFAGKDDAEGVVALRSVSADGRSRVRIDGQMAGVSQLQERVGSQIDLCGQHEHQRLMKVANHRAILDAWGGEAVARAKAAYAQAFEAARAAQDALDAVREAGQLGAAQVEQARFVLRSIDAVGPQEGELDELSAAVRRAENAEALMSAASGAHEALSGDGGALDAIARAASLLESLEGMDASLAQAAQALREASYVVEDASRDVRAYRDALDFDDADLGLMQDRLGRLQGLLRTWGPTMDAVLAARDEAARTLAAHDDFDANLAAAQAAAQAAEDELAACADALRSARAQAAPSLSGAVSAQMERLQLAGCSLECRVAARERAAWTADGADAVEFLFRPGAGLAARPFAKIASGGEISRVMLAVKVVLGSLDPVETLVFDEVDAGVGGSAARALADVIADLAETHQVIVVTHLAQVAVRADAHYVVEKTQGTAPATTLRQVEGEDRVAEVARMLSGDARQASLDHAAQLLAEFA